MIGTPDSLLAPPAPGAAYFARFGVDDALIRETLAVALSRGGDAADLFFQHRVGSSLALEDGAVNRAFTSVELGVGVRVVHGDQTGYGYTEELTKEALLEAARTAAAIADGPSREAPARFHVASREATRYPMRLPGEDAAAHAKLPILATLHELVFAADPRIVKANVQLHEERSAILIADATGRIVEDVQPMSVLAVSCVAQDGSRREQNAQSVAARNDLSIYDVARLERLARETVDRTTILFEAVDAPAGEMPVVLGAGSSGILLHEAIGHGMEADFNRKGTSIYADKIGKRIAAPFVSIVDEGTLPNARGALNVDDEGNAAGTTRLVDGGVLTTYLHDEISAKHYGVVPTGNGRRESYRHVPMPRMRATYMLPGPHEKDEIVRSVSRGIYCSHFANGQVAIGSGDFTFYVKNGWLIEDGRLTKPVKDVNIVGNGPRVLEKVDMVSDDLVIDEGGWTCGKDGQSVPVSQGMPTVRVSSMTVGGRARR